MDDLCFPKSNVQRILGFKNAERGYGIVFLCPHSHHQIALALSAMPSMSHPDAPKRARGRPPGTGNMQRLAHAGEWMNSSAGHAYTPQVITVEAGEDIVSKLLSLAKERPRALCIMSGTGTVSSVTICEPGSSLRTLSFQGPFDILSLGGSYLVNQEAGPTHRTGGITVCLSHPDGSPIGGKAATLIAATGVQVMTGSFVCKNTKSKAIKQENGSMEDKNNESEPSPPLATELTMEAAQVPLDFSSLGWSGSNGDNISTNHNHMTDIDLPHSF